jgi:hypothetical protein
MTNTRLHFEDDGQDFLWWDIDCNGRVINCEPFQSSTWEGNKVVNIEQLKRDGCGIATILYGKEPMSIIHLVTKVEIIEA